MRDVTKEEEEYWDAYMEAHERAFRASMTDDQYAAYEEWCEEQERLAAACKKNQFLDDPITRASGCGSELVSLISCDCQLCREEE